MADPKRAEKSFKAFANRYGWHTHKYGDVRYCKVCGAPQPKTERMPDYSMSLVWYIVECKNENGQGRWNWAEDLGPTGGRINQKDELRKLRSTHQGWLFIELATEGARADDGKGAWLVPYEAWEDVIEPYLMANDIKSIRLEATGLAIHKNYRPGADELLGHKYSLKWERGGWMIPRGHIFWTHLHERLEQLNSKVKEML